VKGDAEPIEWFDTGRVLDIGHDRPRRPRWWLMAAGVAVVAIVAVRVVTAGSGTGPQAAPTSAPATTVARRVTSTASPASTAAARAVVTMTDRLPAATGIELLVHTRRALVRIDLDHQRAVVTAVAALGSTAPTYVIPGRHAVLLRPFDNVAGYMVPDDGPARRLRGTLANGIQQSYVGPQPDTVWLFGRDAKGNFLDLVRFDGARVAHVPIGDAVLWGPDGTGLVIVNAVGGLYTIGLDGFHRATTGALLAAGAAAWLVQECDERGGCSLVRIDRRTESRTRLLPVANRNESAGVGVVSPDGQIAAVQEGGRQPVRVHLIDLATGADTTLPPPADGPANLVWSATSRFLFFVDTQSRLWVHDRATGTTRRFGAIDEPVEGISARTIG
jgi:hypothetical protein